jgi:hypothetical protein
MVCVAAGTGVGKDRLVTGRLVRPLLAGLNSPIFSP